MDMLSHPPQDSCMNLAITPELEALIRRRLATGKYKDASEVVHLGLRLLAEQDDWNAAVGRKIREGVNQLRAGRVIDGEEAIDTVIRNLRRGRGGS
ncbi:MAG: type II toxin-antitoxin system ParD family antitoxin [Planctomycetota bacterium]